MAPLWRGEGGWGGFVLGVGWIESLQGGYTRPNPSDWRIGFVFSMLLASQDAVAHNFDGVA